MKLETRGEVQGAREKLGVNWANVIFLIVAHVAAVAALFFWSWAAVITAVVLYWIGGSLGIGMGYHRLLTHRGYKVPKPVEYFLAICATMALEGGPIQWVVTHRIHHAHADRAGDPHTPRDGGWWAHIGWILWGTAQNHEPATIARYAPDLVKDPFYRLLNRFYYVPLLVVGILLFVFGGWGVLLWGVFLRLILALHSTWLVNSATHLWGRKRFETDDDSRNTWWVALLTFGEGWHNNHHAHPTSARHGIRWYEFDLNWIGIRVLQLLGLAHSIKRLHFDRAASAWQLVSSRVRSRVNRDKPLGNEI
ncbi:MAG TPA: fatty acid desaturase [Pyrinomonadaceae bacterium]|nr:fatty acid desaturase [Pyrinomonadaceae bacterium]